MILATDTGVFASRYQTFTTSISHPKLDVSYAFLVYPSTPRMGLATPGVGDLLKLFTEQDFEFELMLPTILDVEYWVRRQVKLALSESLGEFTAEGSLDEFTRGLVHAPLIPFRASPVSGQSLATLLAGAGKPGTLAGALAGYYFGDGSALLVLTVPGGMIIGGAAYGVASALEAGLHQRILSMISPMPPPEPPQEDLDAEP
jgi:hypothetical protein